AGVEPGSTPPDRAGRQRIAVLPIVSGAGFWWMTHMANITQTNACAKSSRGDPVGSPAPAGRYRWRATCFGHLEVHTMARRIRLPRRLSASLALTLALGLTIGPVGWDALAQDSQTEPQSENTDSQSVEDIIRDLERSDPV